jgi:hypothetical protein
MASRAILLKANMEKAGQTYGHSKIEIDTEGYRDYRGVPVFGAWLWNADLELGLATEIDVAEAMSNYYQIRRTVFGVLGFTLLLSVGTVLLVLILGERTSRALMKARDNLEATVDERTAELQEKQTAARGGGGTLRPDSGFRRGGNLWRRPGRGKWRSSIRPPIECWDTDRMNSLDRMSTSKFTIPMRMAAVIRKESARCI